MLSRPFTVTDQLGDCISESARCLQQSAQLVGYLGYRDVWDKCSIISPRKDLVLTCPDCTVSFIACENCQNNRAEKKNVLSSEVRPKAS